LETKKKAALAVCFALMLSAAIILPAFIETTKAGTQSKFFEPGGPYFWLIKVTNINTMIATVRGYFSEQDMLDQSPYIMPFEPIVVPEGQHVYPPGIFEVTCTEYPEGYAYIKVMTFAVPDDLHLNVTIWFDEFEYYINTFVFARQYPDTAGSWGAPWPRHPAYIGLPHFPIPFHYEWDIHRGLMQESSLVSLDIEPLYDFPVAESDWYNVTAGEQNACGQMGSSDAWHRPYWDQSIPTYGGGGVPFATRAPYLKPQAGSFVINFSLVDDCTYPQSCSYPNGYWAQSPGYPGIVYLRVPNDTWTGNDHTYWSPRLEYWFRVENLLPEDGYGWIFTQPPFEDGVNDFPDVDVYTNNSIYEVIKFEWSPAGGFIPIGSHVTSWNYWVAPSPWPLRCASYRGGFPDIGPDLIPGTDDDGYGDGILDPKGSSILFIPTVLKTTFEAIPGEPFRLLFQSSFPAVLTTESARDLVGPPPGVPAGGSSIYECWMGNGHPELGKPHVPTTAPHGRVLTGEPWQYLFDCEPWEIEPGFINEEAKKTVQYVSQYSVIHVATALCYLDVAYDIVMSLAKYPDSSLIVGDGTGTFSLYPPGTPFTDFKVGWQDLFNLAAAYGTTDEDFNINKKFASPNYDGRYDTNSLFGPWDSKIGWQDLFALAGNYGNEL